jgi:hypothetical protein
LQNQPLYLKHFGSYGSGGEEFAKLQLIVYTSLDMIEEKGACVARRA